MMSVTPASTSLRLGSSRAQWLRAAGPHLWTGLVIAVMALLVVMPVASIILETLTTTGRAAWRDLLSGTIATNVMYEPLANSAWVGLVVATGSSLLGGLLAWLVVMTDMPARRLIGVLATLPFVVPSFATALAWQTLFANELAGANPGLLAHLGWRIPDWLAWGGVPTALALLAQYYSLAFVVISAALAALNAEVIEAARVAGASTRSILARIVTPMVLPAVIGGGMLAFAGAVTNFTAPALLGLPVGFHTLATRMFGLLETGRVERAFVLGIVLLLLAGALVWVADRIRSRSRSDGRAGSGRPAHMTLGRSRVIWSAGALLLCGLTTLGPIVVLAASSLADTPAATFSSFTLQHWFAVSDSSTGPRGILQESSVWRAIGSTFFLGVSVAALATTLGLIVARRIAAHAGRPAGKLLSQLGFAPLLVPELVFATAYLALFGVPLGPLPPLYGTFWLLLLAMTAHLLPFAIETARAVLAQMNAQIEEAARIAGAGPLRRLAGIVVPVIAPGLAAGALMVFVKTVRNISLVIVLFTPTTAVLSIVAFRYASEGFQQQANATTLVTFALAAGVAAIARGAEARLGRRASAGAKA
jgi:iron(III) transport system permease protein